MHVGRCVVSVRNEWIRARHPGRATLRSEGQQAERGMSYADLDNIARHCPLDDCAALTLKANAGGSAFRVKLTGRSLFADQRRAELRSGRPST